MTAFDSDDNALLFGADPTERLVAIEIAGREAVLFQRSIEGRITIRREPVVPWFLVSDPTLLPSSIGGAYHVEKLSGSNSLAHLVEVDDWSRMWGLIGAVVAAYNARHGTRCNSWREINWLHVIASPETQHLIRTGKSLFKGLAFEELHRLQFDLETLTSPGRNFPDPDDPQAAIVIAAISDNRDWSQVIDLRDMTEPELLRQMIEVIRRRDPDVIEGHNILGFDFLYLMRRCERYGIIPALGRDGSAPLVNTRPGRTARSPFMPDELKIFGRHIIDTLPLVQRHDLSADMESHSLKAAAVHFGLAREGRVYVEGQKITAIWKEDPERLLEYALDDVMETEALGRLLSLPLFYQTQMAPMTYQRLAASGVTARLEALFFREHLRTKTAVPVPYPAQEISGGYTHTFLRGVIRNVLYADVHSLYPSIIAANDICPDKDELQLVPRTVRALLSRRLKAKRAAANATDAAERRRQAAISDSFKILVNSIYGYLGFAPGLWNDPVQADRVTTIGREVIRQIIQYVEDSGGKPIEADTDGLYFVPPPSVKTPEEQGQYVYELSAALPAGIDAGLQGRYAAMLSYADKNYALIDDSGRVIIRGSALRSQGLEPYLRLFLREAIGFMLAGQFERVAQLHREMKGEILQRTAPVTWFVRSDRLRSSLEEYRTKTEAGMRGRSAAYELAQRYGERYSRGDRIRYYFTGRSGRGGETEKPKLAEEFDVGQPDYSITRYVRRLDEMLEMLAPLFPADQRNLAIDEGQLEMF